jgi:hypothetical protein
MIDSSYATADKINVYIGLTIGDTSTYEIDPKRGAYIASFHDGIPTVHKWNLLAEEALANPDNKLFMLASDDIVFTTPCWDRALLDHYSGLENKIHVYALQDSRDPEGTPHPIVTREYIEAMGFFLPPLFLHWYCDTWTVTIARSNHCFTHLKDYLLVHDKPSDKGQGDATHNRIRQMGWKERDGWVHENQRYTTLGFYSQQLRTHMRDAA